MKDLTGQRFGRLVAIQPTEMRKNGFVVWECKCDCGSTVYIKRGALTGGTTKSCGCMGKEHNAKRNDLTGQRFGRLTAIRPAEELNRIQQGVEDGGASGKRKSGNLIWECRCDCGSTVFVRGSSLNYGNTKSCGCLRRETAARIHRLNPPAAQEEQGAQDNS